MLCGISQKPPLWCTQQLHRVSGQRQAGLSATSPPLHITGVFQGDGRGPLGVIPWLSLYTTVGQEEAYDHTFQWPSAYHPGSSRMVAGGRREARRHPHQSRSLVEWSSL